MNIVPILAPLAVLFFALVPVALFSQDVNNTARSNGEQVAERTTAVEGREANDRTLLSGSSAVRTRYKISGLFGSTNGSLDRQISDQAFGAGLEVEFRTNTRLRPVVEANFLYGEGRMTGLGRRYQDMEFYTLNTGLNYFPARNAEGFYATVLWGASVVRPNSNLLYYSDPWGVWFFPNNRTFDGFGLTVGMGALMFKRVDVSLRYQALLSHSYLDYIAARQDNGSQGWMTVRMGIVLGGGAAKNKGAPVGQHAQSPTNSSKRVPGGAKGQVVSLTSVVDSLKGELKAQAERAALLEKRAEDAERSVDERSDDIVILSGALEELRNASKSEQAQPRTSMRAIKESPEAFQAMAVYTLLHTFSELSGLDTFRVVTKIHDGGGLRHELQIRTIGGQRYSEELFPIALADVSQPSKSNDVELELLRVRMALSPEAFVEFPVSISDLQRSENRDMLDLPFDLSQQEFRDLFQEKPFVGFRFQSDPETVRTLVFSTNLRRIVNIEP